MRGLVEPRLLAIVIAAGVTISGRYRHQIGAAARDLVIWAAIIAAIIFAIAWIINATGTATNAWFSVTDLFLIGLACLALHQAGIGSAWVRRR